MDSSPVLQTDRIGTREIVRVFLGNFSDLVDNISIRASFYFLQLLVEPGCTRVNEESVYGD